ncbi:MAG: efflux RND transporter periplasmic adaptor subunit, partial [bacterium]|nr:efflux RND transporter periplasmic adaptor subunit [bacterium]
KNYQAQISKTIIRSPINGTITGQDAKVGEIISADVSLVSIISAGNFEIEANIPESDIAKVKIGDNAQVTLDAYGQDVVFQVKVLKIDPAETVIEGVPTYKVTLYFNEKDDRLKSGMTANIDIFTAEVKDVIAIPQRAILSDNGKKTVKIIKGKDIQEIEVKIGLKGTDGNAEILQGLNEGDKVITFIKEK